MGRSNADLVDTSDLFATAALDSSQWTPALRRMADLTGSRRGQLIGLGGPRTVPFNIITDVSDVILDEFLAVDGGNPMVNPRIAASNQASLLQLVTEDHLEALRPQMISEDYADFAATHDIPYGCQTSLISDRHGLVGLALLRSEREGQTGEDERAFFAALAPHVRMAVQVQLALEHEGAKLVAGSLETMSAAAFVCDSDATVVARTPATEALLSTGLLALDANRLRGGSIAGRGGGGEALLAAIEAAAEVVGSAAPGLRSVVLRSETSALVLDVAPLPSRYGLRRLSQVLVVARGADRTRQDHVPLLMALYDLTRTEAETALLLMEGYGRRNVALRRGVSEGTVHSQMKALFHKCGVSREAELIARLSQLLR